MPQSAKKKLRDVVKSLKSSKTFVGIFSHLDRFVIKARNFSFFLVCKTKIVCFYVTGKTFEIFDPSGFLRTIRSLKRDLLCKLASLAQNKKILCNTNIKDICYSVFALFIKFRDSGLSFYQSIKKIF